MPKAADQNFAPARARRRPSESLRLHVAGTCTNYGFIIYTQVGMTKLLVMLSVAVRRMYMYVLVPVGFVIMKT